MTIRECLRRACNKRNAFGAYALGEFLQSMAIALVADADQRLRQPVPSVTIDGVTEEGGAVENPGIEDYASVLNMNDTMRSMGQTVQLVGFIDWLFEQEEPKDGGEGLTWCSAKNILLMWNVYAEERISARQGGKH